jgi:hypothetical protein
MGTGSGIAGRRIHSPANLLRAPRTAGHNRRSGSNAAGLYALEWHVSTASMDPSLEAILTGHLLHHLHLGSIPRQIPRSRVHNRHEQHPLGARWRWKYASRHRPARSRRSPVRRRLAVLRIGAYGGRHVLIPTRPQLPRPTLRLHGLESVQPSHRHPLPFNLYA